MLIGYFTFKIKNVFFTLVETGSSRREGFEKMKNDAVGGRGNNRIIRKNEI